MKKINILLIAALAVIFLLTVSAVSAGFLDSIVPPSKASADDEVFEAIGGDEFLNVTLSGCLKVSEENIPDGSVETSVEEIEYFDAKNITYVDTEGNQDWFVVWKTSPDKYSYFDSNSDMNLYISDYLTDNTGKLFLEYSYEDNAVYGVILGTNTMNYTESQFMYDVLGLSRDGFSLVYSSTGTAHTSSSGTDTRDHYHTVVGDSNSLAHSDPDSYYDHYEYGDNYEADDYLESQGYD